MRPRLATSLVRAGTVALMAAIGVGVAAIPGVQALFAGASYYSNLYEISGGEKVSSLTVYGYSGDWFSCNGYNCTSIPNKVNVSWSIYDGSSTFDLIFGEHYATGFCNSGKAMAYVWAGPGNPSGSFNAYFPGAACTVGYGVAWDWWSGMCDTYTDCRWNSTLGPHIQWAWSPPGSSAFNFSYRWN